jgi:predicted DNA-binding transcriptional regulator AlpA
MEGRLFMTPAAAADFLGVAEGTLRNWRVKGGGPLYRKLGRKLVRYTKADLLEWANGRTFEHTAAWTADENERAI